MMRRRETAACDAGCRTQPPALDAWTDAYVRRRYGPAAPSRAVAAWRVLARTLYSCRDARNDHAADVPTSRPGLSHEEAGQWSLNPQLWYDPGEVRSTQRSGCHWVLAFLARRSKGDEQACEQGTTKLDVEAGR